ncbi:MAG: ketoacyl-ACP synthase III [Acidimicrobiia bacterium]|nr:ketoacyl-ACP synthase III [Acidimicrobiia bacterium]
MGIRITGLGKSAGSRVVTNEDIASFVDTNDEWIRTRTGISQRYFTAEGETTATLAADAARQALKHAEREDVDMTAVATMTPDTPCPSTAGWVQGELGLGGGAIDLNAACSGWVYSMALCAGAIETRALESALVIGAERFSYILDWEDRQTAVIFGDGSGAAVIERTEGRGDLLACDLGNDGSIAHLIQIPAGGARLPASIETVEKRLHTVDMAGKEVFRVATTVMVDTCRKTLAKAGVSVEDVAVFIPHQANIRIISYAIEKLGMPEERTVVNIDRYGNTSAASVPIALCEAWENGRIDEGDLVLVAGFGAGMSWASALFEWSLPR